VREDIDMRLDEYRHHLQEQGISGDGIEKPMAIVGDLVAFLLCSLAWRLWRAGCLPDGPLRSIR
jgi:hypothetical protein